jgi:branched-chain amino acid transport system substrate-binding protein
MRTTSPRRHCRLAAATVAAGALALIAASCGSDNSSSSSGAAPTAATSGSTAAAASGSGIPAGNIKVGDVEPLSGPLAAFGKSTHDAKQASVDWINANGGIAGRQVELVQANDQGDPAIAKSAALDLIQKDHVVAFIGTSYTPQDEQVAAVLTKEHVVGIGIAGGVAFTDPQNYPYNFNTEVAIGPQVFSFVPDYMKGHGLSKLGLVTDNTPPSQSNGTALTKQLGSAGVQIVKAVQIPQTATDVSAELRQLKDAGADSIITTQSANYGPLYNGLRAINWAPTVFIGTGAFFDSTGSIGDLADKVIVGMPNGTCLEPGGSLPANWDKVLATFKARTGQQPALITSVQAGVDSLNILKKAIESTNSVDGPTLKKAIEQMSNQSFFDPSWTYTYTPTDHFGWTGGGVGCAATGTEPTYGTPYLAK